MNEILIPSTVEVIYQEAFAGCNSLSAIKALPDAPPFLYDNSFTNFNVPLYVPDESLDAYKTAQGWKNFTTIGTLSGETPETKKCATPMIAYEDGKLKFSSETEEVEFNYTISDSDIKSSKGAEVSLTATYEITVVATRDGYQNSDPATATLCWIEATPTTEGITTDIANIAARPVMIQARGKMINISGLAPGQLIRVYSANGQIVASSIADNESVDIVANVQSGKIAIVKIGDKSIKVVVR